LALHLDISGCENVFNDHFLMMMSNHTRGRFGGNLITNILNIYKKNSNLSKEEILRKAIIKTYQHYVDEIYEKLVQVNTIITKEPSIQALIDLYSFSKCGKTEEFLI
jgi:Glu-tRNA(Gln) amidotransferase subunit E-like FAD-binding protein